MERGLPTKFGVDPCSGFEKLEFTYGRTDNGRHDSHSADKVKQS